MNTPEPPRVDPNELTFSHQLDLVANARTLGGLKELGDALVSGQLTQTLDLDLKDPDSFQIEREPKYMNEPMETVIVCEYVAETTDPISTRGLTIETDTSPDTPRALTVHGYRHLGHKYDSDRSNKGLHIQMDYKLIENMEGREVHFDKGLIYVQTSTGELAYDAVMVLGADGAIEDVLPPGDYHAERHYGSAIREGEEAAKNRELPLTAIHHLDQLEGSLDETGKKLKHQRSQNQYTALQGEVASLIGIEAGKLLSSKVDTKATFEANMNEPLQVKKAMRGSGEVTVPKVVLTSSKV